MRIGINVPNELLQRLAPLKPELNISQVCREALEAKAASYERMRERLDDGAIIEVVNGISEKVSGREYDYLSLLSTLEVGDWEQAGYEDAVSWVQAAGQKEWDILHATQKWNRKSGTPEWDIVPFLIDGVNSFSKRRFSMQSLILNQDDDFVDWYYEEHVDIDEDAAKKEYMTAWLAYTNAVWDLFLRLQQKNREEYLAERRKQRQEARRDRIPPQVPELLLNRLSVDYQKIITTEPGKRGGQPCIRDMRITVYDVLEYLAGGMTEAEIRADFPELTREDILACYAFAAEPKRRIRHPQPADSAPLLPAPESALEPQPEKPPFRVVPHHGGFAPGVDEMNLNRLNSQLEEEELLAKLARSGPMEPKPDPQPEKPPFRVVPHHGKLAPGLESVNLNHLAAELDTELFLEKRDRDRARERQEEQEKSQ